MSRQDDAAVAEESAGPAMVGVDVGGTKVLAARVDPVTGALGRTVHAPTPRIELGVEVLEDVVTDVVRQAAGEVLAAVGLGAAGFIDGAGDRVRFAPHLAWRDRDVRAVLAERLGVPVALENDAGCAAIAECRYGAGRGARSVVMVTVGTGIGAGIVLDGRLVRGANGMAGELGHTRVVPDGLPCQCGLSGCWEQYCSGGALQRLARAAMTSGPSPLADLAGGDPESVTGPMITAAAEAGDVAASDAFASLGEWLGVGLANLAAVIDPELVVVGGGVGAAGERLLEPARRSLERHLVGAGHRTPPRVVGAALGPAACVVGAASLAAELA